MVLFGPFHTKNSVYVCSIYSVGLGSDASMPTMMPTADTNSMSQAGL